MLENIKIVLVGTTHPGNIGAVARAMKNMCLSHLALVNPKIFPCAEATSRASGADNILQSAQVCESLDEALADCEVVIGASARLRHVEWPQFNPSECASKMLSVASHSKVALIFGRENSGLTNEELDRCHYLMNIPANQEYSSLNLSQAVQVLCYEIYSQSLKLSGSVDTNPVRTRENLATAEHMEGFYQHLEQMMKDVHFSDLRQSSKLMRRLRRVFFRAQPDMDELRILRGILSAAQGRKSMRNKDS